MLQCLFNYIFIYVCFPFLNYFSFVLACVVVVVLYIRVFFSSQWCKLEKQNRHNVCRFFYVQPRFTIESVYTRGFFHH